MKTLSWAWSMIRNPDMVWLNEDGSVFETEHVPRFGGEYMNRWSLRPMWMHYAFTTKPGCGCRKRFGLWNTIWCMDHARFDLDADA